MSSNIMEVDFVVGPQAVMPEPLQTIVLYLSGVILGGFILYALWMSWKYKTAIPVLCLLGGFCTIPMEPIVTFLGHAIHPQIGQINLFETLNRPIPVHIAVIYSFYFGGMYVALFPKMIRREITSDYIWKAYFITCILAYMIEVVPVSMGLWIYYDQQALWLWEGGMPLFWTFVNATCIFVPLMLINAMLPYLTGWKQILVVPLAPMGAIMAHLGVGFPFYSVTNSNWGQMAVEIGGLLSVGLALFMIWMLTLTVKKPTS